MHLVAYNRRGVPSTALPNRPAPNPGPMSGSLGTALPPLPPPGGALGGRLVPLPPWPLSHRCSCSPKPPPPPPACGTSVGCRSRSLSVLPPLPPPTPPPPLPLPPLAPLSKAPGAAAAERAPARGVPRRLPSRGVRRALRGVDPALPATWPASTRAPCCGESKQGRPRQRWRGRDPLPKSRAVRPAKQTLVPVTWQGPHPD
jgi:hypothetical protein